VSQKVDQAQRGRRQRIALSEPTFISLSLPIVVAIALSAIPLLLSLLIRDRKLNNKQNCVSETESVHGIETGVAEYPDLKP